MPVIADPAPGGRAGVSTRVLLLACLPAVAVGVLVRLWLMRTSLSALNADEGVTGLQAFEVLGGRFRTVVAGNEYGSTTETYLFAPILAFWTGVWPLRILPVVLSAGRISLKIRTQVSEPTDQSSVTLSGTGQQPGMTSLSSG